MQKLAAAVAIALGLAVVVISLLPFDRPLAAGTSSYGDGFTQSAHCAAPIESAWTSEPPRSGGWFGYAPLTSTPLNRVWLPGPQGCKTPARHRLAVAALLLVGAVLLRVLPRRRFGPASGTQPNLAT